MLSRAACTHSASSVLTAAVVLNPPCAALHTLSHAVTPCKAKACYLAYLSFYPRLSKVVNCRALTAQTVFCCFRDIMVYYTDHFPPPFLDV